MTEQPAHRTTTQFQPGPYLWDVVLDTGQVLMRGLPYSAVKYSAGLASRSDYRIVLSDQPHPNAPTQR